jgi:hypothetical protein
MELVLALAVFGADLENASPEPRGKRNDGAEI